MAYATSDKYNDELLELASSKIDDLTFNRINAIGFNNLTSFQKSKIESATLAQAEYYDTYGTDVEALASVSVLDTSMSFGSTSSYPGTSSVAIMELKQTGLMQRVV